MLLRICGMSHIFDGLIAKELITAARLADFDDC